uniref:Uncharacterized protein n=1 Tax=Salix viminalis TaxID=40686 RepID=A0A6N2K6C9_SALVM
MANSHLGLTLFSLGLFFSLTKPTFSQDPSPTVFEILPKFGLPSGLLPNTVKSYSLSGDGSFTVYLEKECYVEFDYLVYYEKIITGKLSYGSIVNLKGIQVQRFFLWLGVDNIRVDLPPSDSIYFQVGWINKKLDVDQFKTVHSCRAGVSSGSCGGLWKQFLELQTLANQADEMDEHKEAAKHDFLDINDKKTEKKRETRLQNRLIVDESREDIDAFIKNFRDQLKIQREDSLKRTLPLDDLLGV